MISVFRRALKEYGTTEIVGDKHNPEVLKYFHEIGHEWVKNDELAWCSAFVNWCAKVEGYEFTGKLNARSWLEVGKEIEPRMGCVVVLWRKGRNSPWGHVGFFVNQIGDQVYILGGNQSNQVRISAYSIDRVLSFRYLERV